MLTQIMADFEQQCFFDRIKAGYISMPQYGCPDKLIDRQAGFSGFIVHYLPFSIREPSHKSVRSISLGL